MPWLLDATNNVITINDELPTVLQDMLVPVGDEPGVGLLTEGGLALWTEDGTPILTEGNPS